MKARCKTCGKIVVEHDGFLECCGYKERTRPARRSQAVKEFLGPTFSEWLGASIEPQGVGEEIDDDDW